MDETYEQYEQKVLDYGKNFFVQSRMNNKSGVYLLLELPEPTFRDIVERWYMDDRKIPLPIAVW